MSSGSVHGRCPEILTAATIAKSPKSQGRKGMKCRQQGMKCINAGMNDMEKRARARRQGIS
ncbi:MAG TPA: hypothetical protein DIW62_20300 [Raoultella sp.]|nr:hypothetical protein [Raoultella sp.]